MLLLRGFVLLLSIGVGLGGYWYRCRVSVVFRYWPRVCVLLKRLALLFSIGVGIGACWYWYWVLGLLRRCVLVLGISVGIGSWCS